MMTLAPASPRRDRSGDATLAPTVHHEAGVPIRRLTNPAVIDDGDSVAPRVGLLEVVRE